MRITTANAILLSIKPVFAEKILSGEKKFELRKSIPRQEVGRVYLYVSGGQGIVGCFEIAEIISKPIDELWRSTGDSGTSRERFYKYFSGRSLGHAISVLNPVRFAAPIFPDDIRSVESKFTAPQGFIYIEPKSSLGKMLEKHRTVQLSQKRIRLCPLQKANKDRYITDVTSEISKRYDDITNRFAKNIVKIHFSQMDLSGVNTAQKEVLEVRQDRRLIGFTTLTHKYGYSTKSGPSILFKQYRGKGLGIEMRHAVDALCRSRGRGKLYCTCPDNDLKLVRHLLSTGYRIEGHLLAHYTANRGDFILGKQLRFPIAPAATIAFKHNHPYSTKELRPSMKVACTTLIDSWSFNYWGIRRTPELLREINVIPMTKLGYKSYEEKAVGGFSIVAGAKEVGLCCLMPKRGGAIKVSYFSDNGHEDSFMTVMDKVEKCGRMHGKRKLYTIIPLNFIALVDLFRRFGFQGEGLIRQAYSENTDAIVMGKFL